MTEHFNKLTPSELERLAHLAEECAEVIQAINKIIRHGYESYDPTNPDHKGNRNDLEREIADVYSVITLMFLEKDINADNISNIMFKKILRTKKLYYHHQSNVTDYPE